MKSAREVIYEAEHAKAARWARALIWGSGGAWALAIYYVAFRLWWAELAAVWGGDGDSAPGLLVIGAFLAATLVVLYLLVNQRELVRQKAHAAGLAALEQLDQREKVVSAVGAPAQGSTGES
ncbi:MAG TPA: hypothetical protein VFJ16_08470 [Longimicrobium sp.]|nr:hypothetical protein [Longimicrobium sp.]